MCSGGNLEVGGSSYSVGGVVVEYIYVSNTFLLAWFM